ncbi:TIR domain-containing protein [bacterium]|nr:TIR domain-containing protein [bacterium]
MHRGILMAGSPPAASLSFRYDVYISYSEVDAAWVVDWLLPRLEADGLRVAIDAVTFQPGVPVIEEIERSISESRYVFAVLTPAYVADHWDNFESLLVQHQDPAARLRRLIPLLLEPCEPPARIQLLHWVDMSTPERREDQLRRVLDTVQGRARLPELHPEAAVPDAQRRWWEVRWFAVAGVSALLTLVLVAGWLWSQRAPAAMDPDTFNIAVAEFAVVDEEGKPLRDEIGRQRARNVAALLSDQRDELQSVIIKPITVWGDEQRIRPVETDNAAARAEALNAHVLVYGVVQREGDTWMLQPEFYLTEEVVRQSTELLGDYALGTPISFDAQRLAAQSNANAELRARVRALVQIIIGLSHNQGGRRADYEAALHIFEAVANDPDWGAANTVSGQEILYLFLGNAYLKSAPGMREAPEERTDRLGQAVAAYQQALARRPDYARALNGYASALFQQARRYPDERWPCADDWDWVTLDEARTAHQRALDTSPANKPVSGHVDLRAHLGLGRIYYHIGFCLSEELFPPAWQLAQSNLKAAIAEYEAAPPTDYLRLPTANAHQYLGDMAFLEADWRSFDESLDPAENMQRIAELTQTAQSHYQAGIDLISAPETEESLALRVLAEGQLLRVLCFQGENEAAQDHLDALVEDAMIPPHLLTAIQNHAKEFCNDKP